MRGRDDEGAAMAARGAEGGGVDRCAEAIANGRLTLDWHSSADHTLAHTVQRSAPRRLLNQQEVPMPLINVKVIGDVKALAAGTPA